MLTPPQELDNGPLLYLFDVFYQAAAMVASALVALSLAYAPCMEVREGGEEDGRREDDGVRKKKRWVESRMHRMLAA
eukprot:765423-Hanusia_phi.AAC.1